MNEKQKKDENKNKFREKKELIYMREKKWIKKRERNERKII